jgi:hypothetical protein
VSDIEKIPSLRKDAKQGVPKKKLRDMAKPMAEAGKTRDAPQITPRSTVPGPARSEEPMLPQAITPDQEPTPVPQMEPEPVVAKPEPEPELELEPEPDVKPEPAMAAAHLPEPAPAEGALPVDPAAPPLTMREMFARVEPAYQAFRDAAYRYPAEHMNDRIGDEGWTRKQMLAHIAAWHDLTTDRLIKAGMTGQPVMLDREPDQINAAAARVAIGKTAGEVLKDVEATYARLRRQMLRMTDADLRLGEGWAAERIAGNTYDHYQEHMPDLVPPAALPGSGAQR